LEETRVPALVLVQVATEVPTEVAMEALMQAAMEVPLRVVTPLPGGRLLQLAR